MEIVKLSLLLCMLQISPGKQSIYQEVAVNRYKRDTTINYNEYCTAETVGELQPGHEIGVCDTFNNHACLCILNDKCDYDATTNVCYEIADCAKYNDNLAACEANYCHYNCDDKTCDWFEESTCDPGSGPGSDLATGPSDFTCSQNCFDLCECRATGCDYNMFTGTCSANKELACADTAFEVNECGRQNAIYYKGSSYCRNTIPRGDCTVKKVVLALNFNGDEFLDTRGILHSAGFTKKARDDHGILQTFTEEVEIEFDDNNNNKKLYTGGITADPEKREPNRCLIYYASICEEGMYEVSIKVTEKPNVFAGEKMFNIKFNDITVFAEVDVRKFESRQNRAVELVLNFRVVNTFILISGHEPIPLASRAISISFCYGLCIFFEGSFRINALSIIKVSDSVANSKLPYECGKAKDQWECEAANCYYKASNSSCIPYSGKDSMCDKRKSVRVCGKFDQSTDPILQQLRPASVFQCPDDYCITRIQVMFAFDITMSMNPKQYVGQDVSKNIYKIANDMLKMSPHVEFALTYNANWPRSAFFNQVVGHDNPEGCYIRVVPFTNDFEKIRQATVNVYEMVSSAKPNGDEAILPAMAFGATDHKIGWEWNDVDSNGRRVHRFIVFATDADSIFHLDYPGSRGPFHADGSDSCSTSVPPKDLAEYGRIFTKNRMHYIGLTPPDVVDKYVKHFNRIKTSYCHGLLRDFDAIGKCAREQLQCICY